MNTKLIIVEGIPGSGKTSTAQFIHDWLAKHGEISRLYLENDHDHPVDIDNLSVVSTQQYEQLLAQFDLHGPYLREVAETRHNGFYLHYLRWFDMYGKDIPQHLQDAMMAYNAHDTLASDRYRDCLLERWDRFAKRALNQSEITILECSLMQNPITVFMGKHNYNPEDVKAIIHDLAKRVSGLNPVVIQLRGSSVRDTLQRVIATRPREWLSLVTEYVTQQGYGKAHGLTGLDGVIDFYALVQMLEDETIAELPWGKLVIDNSDWAWEQYLSQIEVYLEPFIG